MTQGNGAGWDEAIALLEKICDCRHEYVQR
jgi:hypothetical protein